MSEAGKTLILGVSGQVGTQLLRQLCVREGENQLMAPRRGNAPDGSDWDLSRLVSLDEVKRKVGNSQLKAIYCVGGMTHVDGCEAQPELAFRTNATGPSLLAKYTELIGVPFVYFSTEYVFDGSVERPGPYDENSPTNPVSVYGRSKLEGEQRTLDSCRMALVLRTTVVYGADPQGKNFLCGVLRNLQEGRRMRVPRDQFSTPTYNKDLATATLALMQAERWGVWHVAGPELMNRFDFASRIATSFQLDGSLLDPVETSELQQEARRPLFAGLSTCKLQEEQPAIRMRATMETFPDYRADGLDQTPREFLR